MLVLAAVSAAVLFTASAPLSSADTVKVFYQPAQDIQVTFPNGTEIERGEELIIVISSQRYDVAASGIMFYRLDTQGRPIMTSSVTSDYYEKDVSSNVVTYTFFNLIEDIEMRFSDLKFLDQNAEDGTPGGIIDDIPGNVPGIVPANAGFDVDPVTAIMAVVALFAAIMLLLMVSSIKKIDSFLKGLEEAS